MDVVGMMGRVEGGQLKNDQVSVLDYIANGGITWDEKHRKKKKLGCRMNMLSLVLEIWKLK